MNFKTFIENNGGFFIEMANPKKGIIEKEIKTKLMPDSTDKDLFMMFTATYPDAERNAKVTQYLNSFGVKPGATLGAQVVRARYGYVANTEPGKSDHIEKDAQSHGVYFTAHSGDKATLVVKGKEIPNVNIGYSELKQKLENYPLGNGEKANVKADLPRFTHPSIAGKIAKIDPETGKAKGQTNGINAVTMGLSGSGPVGWSLAYHKKGVAKGVETEESKEHAKKASSVDKSSLDEPEKERIKRLTSSGNYFIDKTLSDPNADTGLKDESGKPLTSKEFLEIAKKDIGKNTRVRSFNLDRDDVFNAFLLQMRNEYGNIHKYENGIKMIRHLITRAVHEILADVESHKKDKGQSMDISDEDSGKMISHPTASDLERRLAQRKLDKDAEDSPTREKGEIAEPKIHNVRTGMKSHKDDDEDDLGIGDLSKSLHAMKQNLGPTVLAKKPTETDVKASEADLAARKAKLLANIRKLSGGQPSTPQPKRADVLNRMLGRAKTA